MSIREKIIRDYIGKINFVKDDWSMHTISNDLKGMLGETPAFDVSYQKDVMLNEFSGKAQEIKKVSKVSVVFTDDNNKIKKIELLVK